jgi:hypothetical protein
MRLRTAAKSPRVHDEIGMRREWREPCFDSELQKAQEQLA